MDAVRLIVTSRRALAAGGGVPELMAEVWQAQALAQAIGSRLALVGPPQLRNEAIMLADLVRPGLRRPRSAAARPRRTARGPAHRAGETHACLMHLGGLLGDVGIALVGIACAADDEATYWSCVEAIDAADEARDRVRDMLRKLAEKEAALPRREASG